MTLRPGYRPAHAEFERLIKRHHLVRVAEIGALDGKVSRYLLATCPGIELLMVDTRDEARTGRARGELRRVELLAEAYKSRAVRYEHGADEAATHVPDGALDMVIIENDSQLLATVATWIGKLRPGGFLAGIKGLHPHVHAFLDDILPERSHHCDGAWSVQVGDEMRVAA